MKKQVLAILLSTVMLTQTGAAVQALAVEAPNVTSDIVATVNEDTRSVVDSGICGEDLTWTFYDDGELVISGTGAMDDYTFNENAPWCDYKSSINKLTMEYGLTAIGDYAFFDFTSLAGDLIIPDSVISIGERAFYCTYKIKSGNLIIPNSVTSIGSGAFQSCCLSGDLIIPDSITSISDNAFAYCYYFDSLTIPDGVTSIGVSAFNSCKNLTGELKIPESVTSIEKMAFSGLERLTSVIIPDSVTVIGDWAFQKCVGLTSVVIPDSVKTIKQGAFRYCDGLTNVTIPAGIASIGQNVFQKCNNLTDVYFSGTEAEWATVSKKYSVPALAEIHCNFNAVHEHVYNRREVIIEAGCLTDGEIRYSCDCGDVYTEAIPATGHTEETLEGKAATCTEGGLTDGIKCSTCEEVLAVQEVIPAKEHHYESTVYDSTCTEAGIKIDTCANCGDVKTEIIMPKGHSEEVIKGKEATCTEAGLTDGKVCADCGIVIEAQKEIPAKEHDYDELMTASVDCTKDGVKNLVCKNCGDVAIDVIKATGHRWVLVEAVAPTCETAGRTEGMVCADCGDILVQGKTIAPLGHKFGEAVVVKEATCCETGVSEKICTGCGEVETQVIDNNGVQHTDENHDTSCDKCGTSICSCICHTPAKKALYKFYKFFWKLFGIKGKRSCACGTMHW
ncbi:MAG: leucine-rich repeat domain-containing protein [Faecalibacterium sp.]|nr:leucine-rich repeat domain-containing protein [Ruminococcus sp.]MCM1392619.1 leucine-rich repeat domain-containing protein [Ruminococcus sp.]MCM1486643.1 leucine-rich repeat domain-containing protein [Faecalibacterium sp.]